MGDLEEDDFSIPKRRKRNIMMVKTTVSNLRYKNKLLYQKNRRLQRKIESLNEMICVLKTKCMISDNAAINLKVFLLHPVPPQCTIICCVVTSLVKYFVCIRRIDVLGLTYRIRSLS